MNDADIVTEEELEKNKKTQLILCPTCGVMLEIYNDGKSTPNAQYKFVNKVYCGNCGRDMTTSLTHAVNKTIPLILKPEIEI